MDTLTIRKLASETRVSSKTLRHWESRGLLPKPSRTHVGYRVYQASVIKRVQFIRKAKTIGFTLSEIAWLLTLAKQKESTCQEVEAWASRRLAALSQQIQALTLLRKELEQHRRRWRGRLPCPPMSPDEICCLIEELPLPASDSEGR